MPFLPTVSAQEFRDYYPEIGLAFGDNACAPECFVSADRGHEPSTVDELLGAAIQYRQENPDCALADDFLEPPTGGPLQRSFAARLLIDVCNQSLEPDDNKNSFEWDRSNDFGTCGLAEERFGQVLRSLKKGDYETGSRIYVDELTEKPLLLQKHVGSKTAITLKAFRLGGIDFKPGWITGIINEDGDPMRPSEYCLEVSDVARVKALSPQRPSVFAYPINQREIFAANCWKSSPELREIILNWTMQDVILAVQTAQNGLTVVK